MDDLNEFRKMLSDSKNIVFFGGAGVSTESNIPDFRGQDGLYRSNVYPFPPETMLSHHFFEENPKEFYRFYFDKLVYPDAKPNAAHYSLARLEADGRLKAVITQNVDGLHQKAGSRNVIELHGSALRNYCIKCGAKYGFDYVLRFRGRVPECKACGGVVRPDIILYEESLDEEIIRRAVDAISGADMLIVGGTSLVVYPAAGLIRYYRGGRLVLINRDRTDYDRLAELVFHTSIGETLQKALEQGNV